jgi:hypothetical protein
MSSKIKKAVELADNLINSKKASIQLSLSMMTSQSNKRE